MALKTDRSTLDTDISFFMNEVATRGGIASQSTAGSGASMDNGAALVTYKAVPSGAVPVGLLVNDMVDIDLTRQHLNQHKDEVLLRKGYVVTNNIQGTLPSGGEVAFLAHSGNVAIADVSNDDSDATGSKLVVGKFLSGADEDGYAKLYVDLPNTNL